MIKHVLLINFRLMNKTIMNRIASLPPPGQMIPKNVSYDDTVNVGAYINGQLYFMCCYLDLSLLESSSVIPIIMAPLNLSDCIKPLDLTILNSQPQVITKTEVQANSTVYFSTNYESGYGIKKAVLNTISETDIVGLWEFNNYSPGTNSQFVINGNGNIQYSTNYTISSGSNTLGYTQVENSNVFQVNYTSTNTLSFFFMYSASESVKKFQCCIGSDAYPSVYCQNYNSTNSEMSGECEVLIKNFCELNPTDENCVCNLPDKAYNGLSNYPPTCFYKPCVDAKSPYLSYNQILTKKYVCSDLACAVDLSKLTNDQKINTPPDCSVKYKDASSKCPKTTSKTFSTTSYVLIGIFVIIIILLLMIIMYLFYKKSHSNTNISLY